MLPLLRKYDLLNNKDYRTNIIPYSLKIIINLYYYDHGVNQHYKFLYDRSS